MFSESRVAPNLKHYHTFGCPVYVLDSDLQSKNSQKTKWEDRSRVGIHVGISPHQASTVAMVLNLETGLTTPQFHVVFDDRFETIRTNPLLNKLSKWQQKTGIMNLKKNSNRVTDQRRSRANNNSNKGEALQREAQTGPERNNFQREAEDERTAHKPPDEVED